MKNFFTRTLTGVFIVIIVLGGTWLSPYSFILLGLIIIIGSQLELSRLISPSRYGESLIKSLLISIPVYLLSPFVIFGYLPEGTLLIPVLFLVLLIISELYSKFDKHIDSIARIIFIAAYTTIPYLLMVFTAFSKMHAQFTPDLVLGFFVLLWINDTGAYLVGVSIGKHKLFERISPKKTWEGFFGGIVLAIVAGYFLGKWIDLYSQTTWLVIALLISLGGTLGDLFESLIKREAGVKDSGKILPGHGGFLDRFDGVSLAFPLVYLYITFFG